MARSENSSQSAKPSRRRNLGQMLSKHERWIAELDRLTPNAGASDFAGSLLYQFKTTGSLTDKQWYYVGELLKQLKEKS